MQVVIDIPKKIYDAVNNESVCGYMHYKNIWKYGNLRFNVGQAIKDGTPLEDIKAEIRQVVEEEADDKRWSRGLHYALIIIDKHISRKGRMNETDN